MPKLKVTGVTAALKLELESKTVTVKTRFEQSYVEKPKKKSI